MADNFVDEPLVEISKINSNIQLEIRYATANNFVGRPVYTTPLCFARKGVAHKLDNVQRELEQLNLGLKIWDAYR
jgi:D-alanyl-D-alanine dipeptidase